MLRGRQECHRYRRRAQVKVPSASTPGLEYTVDVTFTEGEVRCSCPGHNFRGACHHLTVTEERCGWVEGAPGAEKQTREQHVLGMCPRCGAPTIEVAAPVEDDSEGALRAKGVAVPPPVRDGRG